MEGRRIYKKKANRIKECKIVLTLYVYMEIKSRYIKSKYVKRNVFGFNKDF